MNTQVIEDFIEHSSNVPRDVVRICKLVKEVEEMSGNIQNNLDEKKKSFLTIKKQKSEKTEDLKNQIDKDFKKLLDLNDYKTEQIKDIEFLIQQHIKELDQSYIDYEDDYVKTHKTSFIPKTTTNITSKLFSYFLLLFHVLFYYRSV